MSVRNKSIVLVDHLMDTKKSDLEIQENNIIRLDPVALFAETDWTRFEDDVEVINKIYSYVFNEVVIENRKLVCFWPLAEQFGSDWFELSSLCNGAGFELEIYKSECSSVGNYGLSGEILRTWKKFVYFLIESLLEDIDLNEEFEEIARLTSDRNSITLFKLTQEGKVVYTFAQVSEEEGVGSNIQKESPIEGSTLFPFTSFRDMLEKLLNDNDLSLYQTKFSDPNLEKAYFNILAQEFKTKNLIEGWILTYSMN